MAVGPEPAVHEGGNGIVGAGEHRKRRVGGVEEERHVGFERRVEPHLAVSKFQRGQPRARRYDGECRGDVSREDGLNPLSPVGPQYPWAGLSPNHGYRRRPAI